VFEMEGRRASMEEIQAQEKARKAQDRAALMSKRGAAAARQRNFDAFACDTTRAIGRAPVYDEAVREGAPLSEYGTLYSSQDGMDLLLILKTAC
jgi:hypothetical protein